MCSPPVLKSQVPQSCCPSSALPCRKALASDVAGHLGSVHRGGGNACGREGVGGDTEFLREFLPRTGLDRKRDTRRQGYSAGVLAVAPAEAARLAGVGRTTIYEAIGAGVLKSVKIGKRRLITIEALRAWLLAHEVAA